MWEDLFAALALVMVIEGLLPTISPTFYQKMMGMMAQMAPASIRSTGITTMIMGAILLFLVKNG